MEGPKCNAREYTAVYKGYSVVKWKWVYEGWGREIERGRGFCDVQTDQYKVKI
jgi:hypothetical protein